MSIIAKNCLNCQKLFNADTKELNRGNAKFCSHSCSSQYFHKSQPPPELNATCAFCGIKFHKMLSRFTSKSGLVFCCRKHKDLAQRLDGIKEIHPSHYNHTSGINIYRRIAYEHYPKICRRCKYIEHPEILVVHHIDRNRHNNKVENLEVLCPNCHNYEHFLHQDGGYSGGGKHKAH